MKRLLVFVLLAAGSVPVAQAANFQARAYYWLMTPKGDATIGSGDLEGTTADLEDDLGYDSAEDVIGFRAALGDMHQLGVDFFQLDLSAENKIDKTIRFSDVVFPVTDQVESELDATLIRGFYRMNVGSEKVRGGFLLGGQYIDFDAKASSPSVGSASEKATAGSPVFGVHLNARPIPQVEVGGSIVGADWDFGSIDVTFFDLEVGATVVLEPGFLGGVGYRYVSIEGSYEDDPIDVDVTLSGPIIFAGFQW